jgi:ATP-grasp domain
MPVKVLLATTVRWPSAGRLGGAFAEAGCTAEALLPAEHPAQHSRYFSQVHPYRAMNGLTSLLAAIERARPELIVPLDDRATRLMLRARMRGAAHISVLIDRSLGDVTSYPNLISRDGFIAAAREANIRTPFTHAIASETDLDAALPQTGFPAVLKADGSWGGDGVFVVRDREDARQTYRKLSDPPSLLRGVARAILRSDAHHLLEGLKTKGPAISIQQFIPGRAATTSFACWQGRLLAANHLETLASQEANGPASVLRRIESTEMDEAAARLASHFGLSGLHGLDYIRDEQDRAYLIEINPRSPQSSYLSFGAGHDLVSALAAQAAGRTRPPRLRVAGDIIALFPQEWMRDPASPYLRDAFHDVPWDDPALVRAWMASPEARPALDQWRMFMADNRHRLAAQA